MSAKRLNRPVRDRMLFGVCSGIAEYFDVDPTIVRLLFVLAIFAGGASPLAYIVLAIVMPSADQLPSGQAHAGTAMGVPQAPAQARPSALGDDVVRTVEGAIAKATEGADGPASSA